MGQIVKRTRQPATPIPYAIAISEPAGKRFDYRVPVVCGLLALMVVLVFRQTASFCFVNLDDDQYVYNSPETQLGLSRAGLIAAWTQSQIGNWHPLTTMSWMFDWQLFGPPQGNPSTTPAPAGYHIHNVILHACSVVLLFLLLRRITGALWLSAMVAALFAIHPLRAESVAWVTERKDVLSGLFFVLTLYVYAIYVERPSWLRYSALFVVFALGLMCKAMLVTLPAVMLLLDYWPLRRFEPAASDTGQSEVGAGRPWLRRAAWLLAEKVPLLLLAAVFSAVTAYLSLTAERAVAVLPLRVRMEMAPISFVTYLGKMFYPFNLSAHYPYLDAGPPAWQVVASCLVLLAISAGVLAAWRRHPYLLVGWLWYLVTLSPVSGILPGGNQLMADRYTYITQIGLYVALIWAAADLAASLPHRAWYGAAVSALLLIALMIRCWNQTSYWRDSETLWRHALSCTTDNAIAHEHLGNAMQDLAADAAAKQQYPLARDRTAEAKVQFQEALKFMPHSLPALCDLGNILNDEGKFDEAIALYRRAIEINPRLAEAYYNLGNALQHKGSLDDAIASYEHVLQLVPDHAPAHNNLANLLLERGKTDEALRHYRQAVEANPHIAQAYINLGNALFRLGKVEEATANYRRAVAIDPNNANAYTKLGDISHNAGRLAAAVRYYQKALEADPNCLPACNNLGDLLNRAGRVDEAIDVYRQATKIAPQAVIVWYNLGICLERKERFADALASYQKALDLAESQKDAKAADTIRAKIKSTHENAP